MEGVYEPTAEKKRVLRREEVGVRRVDAGKRGVWEGVQQKIASEDWMREVRFSVVKTSGVSIGSLEGSRSGRAVLSHSEMRVVRDCARGRVRFKRVIWVGRGRDEWAVRRRRSFRAHSACIPAPNMTISEAVGGGGDWLGVLEL
jgi:hypothetical protein